MSQQTAIEWTDHTFNPWWGCTKLSAGCTNCYADSLSTRYGHNVWGPRADRRFFGDGHWVDPVKWNKKAEAEGTRKRVFCASMADVFERHMVLTTQSHMDVERARLWELIEATPMLDWLLLTKRPENIRTMVPLRWAHQMPGNVWLGTSCENQEQANIRIPALLEAPTPIVRFLSCEPLLGPVDIDAAMYPEPHYSTSCDGFTDGIGYEAGIQWVIVGGESGVKARPIDADWVRAIRDDCVMADVAFFFKQWGGRTSKSNGRELDGQIWSQFPSTKHPVARSTELAAD